MLQVDIAASEEEAARAAVVVAHSRREQRTARATAVAASLDVEDDELDELTSASVDRS
jgi:hypothetical protein